MATDAMVFAREFLRHPRRTASIVPSGQALASQMVLPVPEQGDPTVVELGAGTGAFTHAIRRRLSGRGRHMAIELNQTLVERLATRYPDIEVIRADAADIGQVMADHKAGQADVIVSGLPWVLPASRTSNSIVPAVARSLRDDGVFVQVTYVMTRHSAVGRARAAELGGHFEEVVAGRTVWNNVPPAMVYFARRPRRTGGPGESPWTTLTP